MNRSELQKAVERQIRRKARKRRKAQKGLWGWSAKKIGANRGGSTGG